MNLERLLVLSPHTDDAELGSGGTLARLLESGVEVYVTAFSMAEASLPPGSAPTLLRDEFLESMVRLGVPKNNVLIYKYPVRRFSFHRQEILEDLVKLRNDIKPDIIFIPAGSDLHQDHRVIHAEGLRAFKDITVWGYELPWNQISFSAQAFVTLKGCHLEKKWEALKAYKSQFELGKQYFSWEFILGLALVRGVQVKAEYAEAFEVVRVKW